MNTTKSYACRAHVSLKERFATPVSRYKGSRVSSAYLVGAVAVTFAFGGEYDATQCLSLGATRAVTVTTTVSSHSSSPEARGRDARTETANGAARSSADDASSPSVEMRSPEKRVARDVPSTKVLGSSAVRGWCRSSYASCGAAETSAARHAAKSAAVTRRGPETRMSSPPGLRVEV